jgi:hypothetical protein
MIMPGREPIAIADEAWRREEVVAALRARDVGALLRFAQRHTGASQFRLSVAIGMGQGRVNEIINRKREVTRLDVFERIADGLSMPDDSRMVLGLAPRPVEDADVRSAAGRAEITRVFATQAAAAAEIRAAARTARAVDVLAVRALGLIGAKDSLLRGPLIERRYASVRVRVLLLDPAAPAAARRAAEIGESAESFAAGIRDTLSLLADLAAVRQVDLRASVYREAPTWRMISLDRTLYLSAFGANREGHRSDVYKLGAASEGVLHRGFVRHFEDLWAIARPAIPPAR